MNELKEIGGFIVSADPFVQHDNSLSGNGTVNSPLGVVPAYNETVLWHGVLSGTLPISAVLSEAPSAFEHIRIRMGGGYKSEFWYKGDATTLQVFSPYVGSNLTIYAMNFTVDNSVPCIKLESNRCKSFQINGNAVSNYNGNTNATVGECHLTQVVGINRKQ